MQDTLSFSKTGGGSKRFHPLKGRGAIKFYLEAGGGAQRPKTFLFYFDVCMMKVDCCIPYFACA